MAAPNRPIQRDSRGVVSLDQFITNSNAGGTSLSDDYTHYIEDIARGGDDCLPYLRDLHAKGIVFDGVDRQGRTLLHYAAQFQSTALVALLLDSGFDVNARQKTGHTPIFAAVKVNNAPVVRLLMERGADVTLSVGVERTPQHAASWGNYESMLVIQRFGKPETDATRLEDDEVAYYRACLAGDDVTITQLLSRNAVKATEFTVPFLMAAPPLSYAVHSGNVAAVRVLVEAGAPLMYTTLHNGKKSALHRAVTCGHIDVINFLLDSGADITTVEDGKSVLHSVFVGDKEAVIALLISRGAKVDATDDDGLNYLEHDAEMHRRMYAPSGGPGTPAYESWKRSSKCKPIAPGSIPVRGGGGGAAPLNIQRNAPPTGRGPRPRVAQQQPDPSAPSPPPIDNE